MNWDRADQTGLINREAHCSARTGQSHDQSLTVQKEPGRNRWQKAVPGASSKAPLNGRLDRGNNNNSSRTYMYIVMYNIYTYYYYYFYCCYYYCSPATTTTLTATTTSTATTTYNYN